jgi:uncharacterized protein YuzE
MSVHLGPYTFDHVSYDADGDILYLSIGEPRDAPDSEETPEGHILRYDDQEQIIGLTLVNAKWLLDRDDSLSITFPQRPAVADSRGLRTALAAQDASRRQ